MAATYDRIMAILQQASRRDTWVSVTELASNLRQRRLSAFRIRGDGTSIEHFIQQSSMESLLRLCIDLDLLEQDMEGSIKVPGRSLTAIESEEAFARQIRSSVKSYLQNHSAPLETILSVIAKIKLPDVPDAKTIYESFEKLTPKPNLNEDDLRKVLFLLALADGLARKVRVHYAKE